VTELFTKCPEFADSGVSEHLLIFAYELLKEEANCKWFNCF